MSSHAETGVSPSGGLPSDGLPFEGSPFASRRAAALPFGAIGTACVIAGGLVAAVSAPAANESASWAAAYLVLVAGVAQIGLGVGSALLAPRAASRTSLYGVLALWNLGNAAVLAGVLLDATVLVDLGGLALVVAVVAAVRSIRGSTGPSLAVRTYWLLAVIIGVSVPIGLVMSRIRGG
ncbi:MAG: hypothetical protein ACOH17_10730 [Cellulomonas sp.]